MLPLNDLIKGLEILEPFLAHYGFKIDEYENGKSSGGQFTIATYKNGPKRFNIGYRFSIGALSYCFEDYEVNHSFYLDYLGLADEKQFPDFHSDDKLLTFRNVLHDLDFLIDDFFRGSCVKLIEASIQQKEFIDDRNSKAQEESINHYDRVKILEARINFKEKDYKSTLKTYKSVENKLLLSDYDRKIIEFCKKHVSIFYKIGLSD